MVRLTFEALLSDDFISFDDSIPNQLLLWLESNDIKDHKVLVTWEDEEYNRKGTPITDGILDYIMETREMFTIQSPFLYFIDYTVEEHEGSDEVCQDLPVCEVYRSLPSDFDFKADYMRKYGEEYPTSTIMELEMVGENDFLDFLRGEYKMVTPDALKTVERVKESFLEWQRSRKGR